MHLQWRLGAFGRHTWQNQDSAPKKLPRSRAAKQGNSMAWRAQGDRFWTALGWSSVSNVASRTYKKRGFCSWGLQFAPRSGFSAKRCVQNQKKKNVLQLRASICTSQWLQFAPRIGCEMHLEWRLGTFERHTRQNQDSAPKKLPRSRAATQGNSMAWRAQGDRFWTCVGVDFSVKRCVQNL